MGKDVPRLGLMKIDNVTSQYPPLPTGDNSKRPPKERGDGSETVDNLPIPKDVSAYRLTIWPQHLEEDKEVVKSSLQDLRLSQKRLSESYSYPSMNLQSSHGYYGTNPAFRDAYMAYTIFDRQYPTGVYIDILV
jgi:hypothetical protein